MYLFTGCSEPIIKQWIHTNNKSLRKKKFNTKNVIFSKPVAMFYHPVDRWMGLQKTVVYWVNQ